MLEKSKAKNDPPFGILLYLSLSLCVPFEQRKLKTRPKCINVAHVLSSHAVKILYNQRSNKRQNKNTLTDKHNQSKCRDTQREKKR